MSLEDEAHFLELERVNERGRAILEIFAEAQYENREGVKTDLQRGQYDRVGRDIVQQHQRRNFAKQIKARDASRYAKRKEELCARAVAKKRGTNWREEQRAIGLAHLQRLAKRRAARKAAA